MQVRRGNSLGQIYQAVRQVRLNIMELTTDLKYEQAQTGTYADLLLAIHQVNWHELQTLLEYAIVDNSKEAKVGQ
jgi:hypothetical protein